MAPELETQVAVVETRVDRLERALEGIQATRDLVLTLAVKVDSLVTSVKECAGKIDHHTRQLSSLQVQSSGVKTKVKLLAAIILGSGTMGAGVATLLKALS